MIIEEKTMKMTCLCRSELEEKEELQQVDEQV